ncbi:MAG: 6-bladed beta-propeller [Gemmatimonadota bacterium]
MRIPAICLLAITTACSEPRAGPPPVVMRDSAGIRIVENASLELADSIAWVLDTANVVSIGELDGPDMYVFGQVAGVTRQNNGRIVVADRQAHQVRFFGPDGRFSHAVGRAGGGPGEYINVHYLLRHNADSLIVIDYEGGRINILDPEGKWVRSFRLEVKDGEQRPRNSSPTEWAVFDDGSLLISDHVGTCRSSRDDGAVCADSARFSRVTMTGQPITRYGILLYMRYQFLTSPKGLRINAAGWHPQASWSVQGARFYHADATSLAFNTFGSTGNLERITRTAYQRPPVRANVLAPSRPVADLTPQERDRQTDVDAGLANARRPDQAPAFAGLMVDRTGNVWLQEHPAGMSQPAVPRWFVFDTIGTLRASIRVPINLTRRPLYRWQGEIGDDYVLGVANDEGIEVVRLYPLIKRLNKMNE